MAQPTTRNDFKNTCLRRLGKGVINVEVSADQVEDRVDFALRKFADYHFDGSDMTFYSYQIQDADKTNRYVPVPDNVLGVVEIFDLSSFMLGGGIFNATYQFVLQNVWDWQSQSLIPYYMAFQNIQLIEQILVGKQPIRYNRYMNRLYIDMDWTRLNVGDFLIARAYQVVDPEAFPRCWSDAWLQQYATAQIKQQWGTNLKKFSGMPLPGNVTFNGQQIFDEAQTEIEKLEYELINSYSLPVLDMVG